MLYVATRGSSGIVFGMDFSSSEWEGDQLAKTTQSTLMCSETALRQAQFQNRALLPPAPGPNAQASWAIIQ